MTEIEVRCEVCGKVMRQVARGAFGGKTILRVLPCLVCFKKVETKDIEENSARMTLFSSKLSSRALGNLLQDIFEGEVVIESYNAPHPSDLPSIKLREMKDIRVIITWGGVALTE